MKLLARLLLEALCLGFRVQGWEFRVFGFSLRPS